MNHRDFKTALNEQFARIAKAVANPHRIEILDILAQGERSVEEIAKEAALTIGNTSQHLQGLRESRLIASRKQGLHVYYRLTDPSVFRLIQIIREIAQAQLAEVNQLVESYFTNRAALEPITLHELYARLDEPDLVVLDVRPNPEYAQGHIPGARSIPINELEQRLGELAPEQEIVAYCRGPYCVFADEAVELLSAHGYQVQRLQEGYPDWLLALLPTEANK
ncbi:MAG: transcriptional regulator [Chloroflexota bacterium]|nr:ArsR family transcriptional regulator [Chloroflexota bacterium]NOG65432.1 metalloregulator ArsR/SmtB family transcription factor [Chloroflexota bacterium]GIK64345.1 MAG: transcriptional regulator [Chloroflexota bacterium]